MGGRVSVSTTSVPSLERPPFAARVRSQTLPAASTTTLAGVLTSCAALPWRNSQSAKQAGRAAARRTSFAEESRNLRSAAAFPAWASRCRPHRRVREYPTASLERARRRAQSIQRRRSQKGVSVAWVLPPNYADDSALTSAASIVSSLAGRPAISKSARDSSCWRNESCLRVSSRAHKPRLRADDGQTGSDRTRLIIPLPDRSDPLPGLPANTLAAPSFAERKEETLYAWRYTAFSGCSHRCGDHCHRVFLPCIS